MQIILKHREITSLWIRNRLTAIWIVRHIPLLKEVFRPPNRHDKAVSEPMQECIANNQNCTLWLVSIYSHQLNLRKTLPQFLLLTDLSLYPLTYQHSYNKLTKLGITIIQTTSQIIKDFTTICKWTSNIITSHTSIYFIPCNDCDKYYIGKTQCNLET